MLISLIKKIVATQQQIDILKRIMISLWLDCDPGLDDTFAIIYAAYDKNIDLLGISTSPGNTNLVNTTQNALDVLYNIGKSDVTVYVGSNQLIKGEMKFAQETQGSNGLGGVKLPKSPKTAISQNSFQNIFMKITENPNPVVWANTGSLTNLCLLLQKYPSVKSKIEKIVIMGGAIGKGNQSPAAQFNIFFDPHALDNVLRLKEKIPFYMIPLEVTHQNLATQQILDHFRSKKNIPFAQCVSNMLQQFKAMYFKYQQFSYPPIHDPLTIFYILHPEEFDGAKAHIEVDTGLKSYGRTNCYFYNPFIPQMRQQSMDWVATNLRNEKTKFWEEMLKIFDQIFSERVQKLILYH